MVGCSSGLVTLVTSLFCGPQAIGHSPFKSQSWGFPVMLLNLKMALHSTAGCPAGAVQDVKVMGSFDGWTYGEQMSPEATGTMTRFTTVLKVRPGRWVTYVKCFLRLKKAYDGVLSHVLPDARSSGYPSGAGLRVPMPAWKGL